MAKLVTSDGVQVNLFLDLDSHNTGEGTLLYGPKSQAEMDFIVKGFRNFKTNSEYNNKNRLEFHSDVEIEVSISALMSANPTSSSQYTVPNHSNTKLYFVGDDLVLSKTGAKIHRIDLFKSASTNNVFTVNGNSPDSNGNVTVTAGVSSVNGQTGDVTVTAGVSSVNGQTGDVTVSSGVTSVNNKTGNVNISAGSNISINNSGSNVVISSTGGDGQTVEPNWSTGWVNTDGTTSVANGATLSFTHNLNSTDVIYQIYASDNANGTNAVSLDYQNDGMSALTDQWGAQITDISNNSFKLRLAYGYFIRINDHNLSNTQAVNFTGHYIKVVASSAATSIFDGDYNSLTNKPSLFDGDYNSLDNQPTIPSDVSQLSDSSGLLSSGGGGSSSRTVLFKDLNNMDYSVSIANTQTPRWFGPVGWTAPTNFGNSTSGVVVGESDLFKDFKINHANKHKLVIYTPQGNFDVLIQDLIEYNPSGLASDYSDLSDKKLLYGFLVYWDDQSARDNSISLFFDNNDLIIRLRNHGDTADSNRLWMVYRVDLHNFADLEADVYTKSEVDSLVSSSGGGGGGSANGEVIEGVSNTGTAGFGMLIGGTVFTGGPDSPDTNSTSRGYSGENVNIADGVGIEDILPASYIDERVVKFDVTTTGNAFALTENGNLYAWGKNKVGSCGAGHTNPIEFPVLVASNVDDIYFPLTSTNLGFSYVSEEFNYDVTIIKKNDGYLYGCGYNGFGTLGLGHNTDQWSFVKLTNFGTGIRFVANTGSSRPSLIVQRTNYDIYVTGWNLYGHLGITAASSYNTPQLANGWKVGNKTIINKVETSLGGLVNSSTVNYEHTNFWILLSNNENIDNATEACIRVCGSNPNNSLLGFNNSAANISTPATLQSFTGNSIPKDLMWHGGIIGAGMWFDRSGNLYGWGFNSQGTLGNGTVTAQITPTLLTTGVTKMFKGIHPVTWGDEIVVFISKSGTIYSTGWNNFENNSLGREPKNNLDDATWGRVNLPQSYSGTPKFVGGLAYYRTTATSNNYTTMNVNPILVDSNNNVFALYSSQPSRITLNKA